MTAHLTIRYQMYTMEQEKRGLCQYDDKRYLCADLPDGRPNPNTHAYGHCDMAVEEYLVADQPEPGTELIILHLEERFARRQVQITKRLELAGAMDMEEELYDGDADGELHGKQIVVAERVAAARPGGAIRMGDVIERIIARDNLERPISPPARMPEPPTPQRAEPSWLNANLPTFRCRIDSSDEDEPVRIVCRLAVRTWSWRMVITSKRATPSQSLQDAGRRPDAALIRSLTPKPSWTGMRAAMKELKMKMMT